MREASTPIRHIGGVGDILWVRDGSDDGVVKYSSSHLDGVDSEYIVRSGHSVQSNPYAIEEVRRILLLHAADACTRILCGPLLAPPSTGLQARQHPDSGKAHLGTVEMLVSAESANRLA